MGNHSVDYEPGSHAGNMDAATGAAATRLERTILESCKHFAAHGSLAGQWQQKFCGREQ